ncbi:MAG: aromatic ring-hydroxylating dioxygenase subunit alpha, partial [Cyanobacteria bacterium P01_A01_bin.135]
YPHYASSLEGVSSVYLMRLPVDFGESRSFALFFFRLSLPNWLVRVTNPLLRPVIRKFMLRPFLEQDIEMMESEQRQYDRSPDRCVEINPAIIALQRVMVRQYEQAIATEQVSQIATEPGPLPSAVTPNGREAAISGPLPPSGDGVGS